PHVPAPQFAPHVPAPQFAPQFPAPQFAPHDEFEEHAVFEPQPAVFPACLVLPDVEQLAPPKPVAELPPQPVDTEPSIPDEMRRAPRIRPISLCICRCLRSGSPPTSVTPPSRRDFNRPVDQGRPQSQNVRCPKADVTILHVCQIFSVKNLH